MFRRNENDELPPARPQPSPFTPPQSTSVRSPEVAVRTSIIGSSLHVKGEITGAEDLSVEGIVEGNIRLNQNTVSVGKSGRVQAGVYAKVIHVEGEVTGDLFASEAVVVHRTGCVRGNINSPRVTLEDGARLKGSIDTEAASVEIKMAAADSAVTGKIQGNTKTEKTESSSKKSDSPPSVGVSGASVQ